MPVRVEHKDVGDVWTPQFTFTVADTPTDPTTITVKILKSDGTITTLGPVAGGTGGGGIIRDGAGVFHIAEQLTAAGYLKAYAAGTGAAEAAEVHEVIVDPSEFFGNAGLAIRSLVGLAETKDWLQQQSINTDNDLELVRTINAVSERAHQEAGREFKAINPASHIRLFPVDALAVNRSQLLVGDMNAATLVRVLDKDGVAVATVTASDYTLHPSTREAWEPAQRIRFGSDVAKLQFGQSVEVTATWGFPSVPEDVRQAVLDAVAATMDRDVEHYRQDLSPAAPDTGTVVMVGFGRQRLLSMPPVSLAALWGYRGQVYA